MRQMKDQQERNRAAECRRNREIASLKKDQRRAEVRGMERFKQSCLLPYFPVFFLHIFFHSTFYTYAKHIKSRF